MVNLMRLWLAILLTPLLISTGCAVNPVTGKNELSFISEADEIAMGAKQYVPAQQAQGGQFVTDPELSRYVNSVGQRVAAAGDRNLPYEFVVLNNSVPNAWALPGGKISINRGLLVELENEAELAAVLGHEAVHAAAKHGANSVQRGMILNGLVTATAIGAAVSDSDYSNYVVGGAQLGSQLISHKYGRNAELESDYYGTKYMAAAGYDPAAAIALQQTFVRLSEGTQSSFLDGLFASHPPSQDRVNANRSTVAELGDPGGDLGEGRYQAAIKFLKENSYAYQSFDEAQTLFAKGEYDNALGNLSTALTQVPSEARFHGLQGNIHYQSKRYDDAKAAYARAIELDSNYFEYYLGQGLVSSKQGNRAQAKQYLEKSNALLPTAVASQALGELSLVAGNRGEAKEYFSAAMNVSGSIGQDATLAFIKLDLTDNPGRYFRVEPKLSDAGHLVATITNLTPFSLSGITVQFNATARGQTQRRAIQMPIAASDTEDAISGWQLTAEDGLADVTVVVTNVTL
jgi:predicted Zn-dependent protease